MSRKKLIITAILLVLILAIGGMLAYFTDVDTAANNFTLGQVNISVNETFTPPTDLMPGDDAAKAAVIDNNGNSTVYVFAEVTIPKASVKVDNEASATVQELFTYTWGSDWEVVSTDTSETDYNTYVLSYSTSGTMTDLAGNASTTSVFENDTVTLKNIVEDSTTPAAASVQGTTVTINITGKGIQKDGLPTSATTPAAIYDLI